MTGLCECGCGNPAPISNQNRRQRGIFKGQPVRFIRGHAVRGRVLPTRRQLRESDYRVEDRGHSTECWIWQGFEHPRGYGLVTMNGRSVSVHRAYYREYVGPIPTGLVLDHLCRVKLCVNPDHLEAVTQTENVRRGRAVKIPDHVVEQIRAATGTSVEIARRFGISQAHAWDLRNGRSRVTQ